MSYPNKRDCEHGSMRGKCNICEYEQDINELELKLGISETEINILKEEITELNKRIAELEQERDECAIVIASMVRQTIKDGSNKPLVDFCGTAAKALEQRDLEMQARGIEEIDIVEFMQIAFRHIEMPDFYPSDIQDAFKWIAHDLRQQSIEAVEKCEAELPRNQHCEVVISAKVKGGDV